MREIERVAIKDDVRAHCRLRARISVATKRVRKKKHWQLSPVTRVRVRQRIRRWDGYLYNIDLSHMLNVGY
jgi:hypothetical protein